jgi:sugar lactone lactonase YvrE
MTRRLAAALLVLGLGASIRPVEVRTAAKYQLVENWAQLPPGTQWGVMSWVSVDARGQVYAFQRDEPTSKVLVFDTNGKYLRGWGEGEFPYPHSLRVLRDGFIWLTDRKSQQLLKFTPEGKLLLALGEKGVAGDNTSRTTFNGVSDVVMAANGDLFVSDGEGGNTRVVKFSRDGTFIKYWGTKGSGPGEFGGPHCVAMDSQGRVYVCDRGNKRIQVFDQEGRYLSQMAQFGTPVSIAFGKDDLMFVAAPAPENRLTIGTTSGQVVETMDGLNSAHGIAVDGQDNLYVAESAGKAVLKYVRK